MKLTFVVILGLIAVSVKAQSSDKILLPQGEIFDELKKLVENAVKEVKEILEKISIKQNEILEKAKQLINRIKNEALEKIDEAIKKIDELSKLGEVAKECVNQHSNEIEEIENGFNADIQVCIDAAKNDSIEVEREIWQTYMLMVKNIEEMHDIVEECIEEFPTNHLEQIICGLKRVKEFKNKIEDMYELAKGSLQKLEEIVPRILKDLAVCVNTAKNPSLEKLDAVFDSIQKCIAENHN